MEFIMIKREIFKNLKFTRRIHMGKVNQMTKEQMKYMNGIQKYLSKIYLSKVGSILALKKHMEQNNKNSWWIKET